jgi:hypothetical protein
MERSGKVIIFDSEEDAKVWFASIEEVMKENKIASKRIEMESWIKMMKEQNEE